MKALTLLTFRLHCQRERIILALERRHQRAGGPILCSSVYCGEPILHYEAARAPGMPGIELGFHCEARDRDLNRYLLKGFRHHLFEIKDQLGESVEAEMWDRGWTKIYDIYPDGELTPQYQAAVGVRMAEIIICLHPFYVELRGQVARAYR